MRNCFFGKIAPTRRRFHAACAIARLFFCSFLLLTLACCGLPQSQTSRLSPASQASPQGSSTVPGAFSDLHMISMTVGWAVSQDVAGSGNTLILRTTDSGAHWSVTFRCVPTQSLDKDVLETCGTDFRSATLATVVQPEENKQKHVSQLRVFHTTNGGATWQSSLLLARALKTPATFVDALHGWALVTEHFPGHDPSNASVGQDISLYRTSDGGQSWQKVASDLATLQPDASGGDGYGKAPLIASAHLMFSSATTGWLTGQTYQRDGSSQGWLSVTHDGGTTWQPSSLVLPTNAFAPGPPVFFTPQTGILLVSVNGQHMQTSLFCFTQDGGATWLSTAVPFDITSGAALDWQHAWSIPTSTAGTTIATTSDGWRHWTQVTMNIPFGRIYDLSFVSPTIGWAFGDDLMDSLHAGIGLRKGDVIALLKTTNGGKTWQEVAHSLA